MAKKRKRPAGLTQADIVWNDSENYDCTRSASHGMYSSERGRFDKYQGNSALCNYQYGISEGGPYLPIEDVPYNSTYEGSCKSCQKIFDKLPITALTPSNP